MLDHGYPKDWSTLKKLIWQWQAAGGGSLPWATFTGNPLTFDSPKAHALKSATVSFEPIQEGTGDPSPVNKRPILGRTSLDVNVASYYNCCIPSNNPAFGTLIGSRNGIDVIYIGTGKYRVKGTATSNAVIQTTIHSFETQSTSEPNRKIRFHNTASGWGDIYFYNSSGAYIDYWQMNVVNRQGGYSALASKTVAKIEFDVPSGVTVDCTVQPEFVDTTYLQTYSVTWQDEAGTVYGGTLDVTTGVLTVTHKLIEMDGSENWVISSSWGKTNTAVFYINGYVTDAIYDDGHYYWTVNEFVAKSRSYIYNYDQECAGFTGSQGNTAPTVRINKTTASDAVAFKAWLSEHPLQICYKLINPVTYQLTPTQIDALLGINTMWTDADDLTVEAKANAVT